MSLNRYAKRRDDNEPEIIQALEAIGCTVYQLDEPCDLLVGRGAKNLIIEVKDGNKQPSRRQLTDNQKDFFANWKGQVCQVKNVDEAIAVVQELTVKTAYP